MSLTKSVKLGMTGFLGEKAGLAKPRIHEQGIWDRSWDALNNRFGGFAGLLAGQGNE